jgi:hypothetical protein
MSLQWRSVRYVLGTPYQCILTQSTVVSMREVRARLAEEEQVRARVGTAVHDSTSPSGFILLGFQLETMQSVSRFFNEAISTDYTLHPEMSFARRHC